MAWALRGQQVTGYVCTRVGMTGTLPGRSANKALHLTLGLGSLGRSVRRR